MNESGTIYDFILTQEANYKVPIQLTESWSWNMHSHIRKGVTYYNSQLMSGKDDWTPVKNIMRAILNLAMRAEGFDVKDIVIFIDDSKKYFKSLLLKKYHETWALKNGLDTVIDSIVESFIIFGGALVKSVKGVPELVPLQSVAFCDQTDILSGPIGIKHFYSPDQLLEMAEFGWGDTSKGATASLEQAIILSRNQKKGESQSTTVASTPGKYIEVYEVHGTMPDRYLNPESEDKEKYTSQLQIVCFYNRKDSDGKGGITLFKGPEKKSPFKLIKRDPIYGRALGFGGVEELEEPQVWTNLNAIWKKDMLEAASKTILISEDGALANRTKVRDLDNLSIIEEAQGGNTRQLDTFPRNLKLFDASDDEWLAHARSIGSSQEAISGDEPAAGTPFKSLELQSQESHSLHEYRKGKLATFIEEIYREDAIPSMIEDITDGVEFLAELDLDELQYVSDSLVTCEANDMIKQKILNGELVDPAMVEGYKEIVKGEFQKKGNTHFMEILKGEFSDESVGVKINVAGKQKDLSKNVDKITNIVRFLVQANPAILTSPGIWDLINQTIEQSGLDPVDFSGVADDFKKAQQQQAALAQQQATQQPQPQQNQPQYA